MGLNDAKKGGVKLFDVVQLVDQNIIKRFCIYVIIQVDDPVSELAHLYICIRLAFRDEVRIT